MVEAVHLVLKQQRLSVYVITTLRALFLFTEHSLPSLRLVFKQQQLSVHLGAALRALCLCCQNTQCSEDQKSSVRPKEKMIG